MDQDIQVIEFQNQPKISECVNPNTGEKFVLGETMTRDFPERWYASGAVKQFYNSPEGTATLISMSKWNLGGFPRSSIMLNFRHLNREPVDGESLHEVPYKWGYSFNIEFSEKGLKYND